MCLKVIYHEDNGQGRLEPWGGGGGGVTGGQEAAWAPARPLVCRACACAPGTLTHQGDHQPTPRQLPACALSNQWF